MNLQHYKQLTITKDNDTYIIERIGENGAISSTVTESIDDVIIAAFVARTYNVPVKATEEVYRDYRNSYS